MSFAAHLGYILVLFLGCGLHCAHFEPILGSIQLLIVVVILCRINEETSMPSKTSTVISFAAYRDAEAVEAQFLKVLDAEICNPETVKPLSASLFNRIDVLERLASEAKAKKETELLEG